MKINNYVFLFILSLFIFITSDAIKIDSPEHAKNIVKLCIQQGILNTSEGLEDLATRIFPALIKSGNAKFVLSALYEIKIRNLENSHKKLEFILIQRDENGCQLLHHLAKNNEFIVLELVLNHIVKFIAKKLNGPFQENNYDQRCLERLIHKTTGDGYKQKYLEFLNYKNNEGLTPEKIDEKTVLDLIPCLPLTKEDFEKTTKIARETFPAYIKSGKANLVLSEFYKLLISKIDEIRIGNPTNLYQILNYTFLLEDENGYNLLHHLAASNAYLIIEVIVDDILDLLIKRYTFLEPYKEAINRFLTQRTKDNLTPLDIAAKNKFYETTKTLLCYTCHEEEELFSALEKAHSKNIGTLIRNFMLFYV